ncbi:MAG: serine hydrolase domain-containing protein [Parvularculaceae bacterium]
MSFRTILIALMLGCTACAHAPASVASAETAATDGADIDEMLRFRIDVQRRATGAVVGVVTPEGARYHAYGSSRLDGGTPVTEKTVFDIGSLTKVFTAYLLSDAATRGELSLDDPIGKHLQNVSAPSFNGAPIRLADLASHRSGLPLRPPNLSPADPDNPYAGYTTEQMIVALDGYPLTQAPGTQFLYSNWAYGLLGYIVAENAHADYETLLSQKLLKPLGMKDTSLTLTRAAAARRPQGYNRDFEPATPWDFGALAPAGGLHSTAADMLKFLAFFIDNGDGAMQQMLNVAGPADFPNTGIGLGWRVTEGEQETFAWSNGYVGGFRAFMGYNPRTRTGVIALANAESAFGLDDIGMHILDPEFTVDMDAPVAHTEITLDAAALDRVTGRYVSADDAFEIIRKGGAMFCILGTDEIPIFAEAPDRFFLKVVEATLTFDLPASGGPATGAVWRQNGVDFVYSRAAE